MRLALTLAQTLESLAMAQDLAPRLGQGGEGGQNWGDRAPSWCRTRSDT